MVDYAQFFVDPRPYSDSALARLAGTMYNRDKMAREIEQNDFENRLAMQKYQSGLEQQGFENRLAMGNLGVSQGNLEVNRQNAETNAGNLAVTQQKAQAEQVKRWKETAFGLMSGVRGPEDFPRYVEQVRTAEAQGQLPKGSAEQTAKMGYDPRMFDQVKMSLAAELGKEMYGAPALIPGGGGAVGVTNPITGETKPIVGRAPVPPKEADPNAPLTKPQAIKLAQDLQKTASAKLFGEDGYLRVGPEGNEKLYEDLQDRLTAALDKDLRSVNNNESNYPENVSEIVQEINAVQQKEQAWNDFVQGKVPNENGKFVPDPTQPQNQVNADGTPRILNLYRNGKIVKYVNQNGEWVQYKPKGASGYGK